MEKKPFLQSVKDKIAEKTVQTDSYQASWAVHTKAFGPILEPAFREDHEARVRLVAALNRLSRGELQPALDGLMSLKDRCKTRADFAALLFFLGLTAEYGGDKDAVVYYYQEANSYGHDFYMPYLRLAKIAHRDGVFDVAEANYSNAIDCLLSSDGIGREGAPAVRSGMEREGASALCNYISCLTMMHRYDDAMEALKLLNRLPYLKGKYSAEAILYAAMGDGDRVAHCLISMERTEADLLADTRRTTHEILAGKHSYFTVLPVDTEGVDAFWSWLGRHEQELLAYLEQEAFGEAFVLVQDRLRPLIAFQKREPELAFSRQEDGRYCITLADFYCLSLEAFYQALNDRLPAALAERWCIRLER